MNNIYQIGPAVKLQKEVYILMSNLLSFKTKKEIFAKYKIMSVILEACKEDGEIIKQLQYVVNSLNAPDQNGEASRILPSMIKDILDEYLRGYSENNPVST